MRIWLVVFLLLAFPLYLSAQNEPSATTVVAEETPVEAPAPDGIENAPLLKAVSVSGVQPGPGLWRVSKEGRVLWILGVHSPIPKRMQWKSEEVEQIVASANEIISSPSVDVDVDAGFFKKLTLIPAAMGARKNPDDKKLQEVLPPDLYARWLVQKNIYMPRKKSVESWRPLVAAAVLFNEAMDDRDLSSSSFVTKLIGKVEKKHDVPRTSVASKVMIKEPRAKLKGFRKSEMDDAECFEKTLLRLETDMDNIVLRANAWAVGDIEAMRALKFENQNKVCGSAILNSDAAKELNIEGALEESKVKWLAAVETALNKNDVTFAALGMVDLFDDDGMLARLRAKGYYIEEPL